MDDAFNLPEPSPTPTPPPSLPSPDPMYHHSVQEAIAHLIQLKAYALTFEGRDGMNPHLWIQQKGIDRKIQQLQAEPTTELVEVALQLQKEEPNINLFTHLYAPTNR